MNKTAILFILLLVSIESYSQQSENNLQLPKGRLELYVQQNVFEEYDRIIINPCTHCPG